MDRDNGSQNFSEHNVANSSSQSSSQGFRGRRRPVSQFDTYRRIDRRSTPASQSTTSNLPQLVVNITRLSNSNINPRDGDERNAQSHDAVLPQADERNAPEQPINRELIVKITPISITHSAGQQDDERNAPPAAVLNKQLVINLTRLSDSEIHRGSQQQQGNVFPAAAGDQDVVDVARPVLPQRRVWGDNIARKNTWKTAVGTSAPNLERLCRNPFVLGNLCETCAACGARFFKNEFPKTRGTYSFCCKNGAIVLPALGEAPAELTDLLTRPGRIGEEFRTKIRAINNLLAMASFQTSVPGGAGNDDRNIGRCFAVTGQIFHYFNGVPNTQDLTEPRLNHYYFLDVAEAMGHRTAFALDAGIDPEIFEILDNMLRRVNPFIRAYMTMAERLRQERLVRPLERPLDDIYIGFTTNVNERLRNFNLPESRSDVAAIFVGDEPPFPLDMVLYPRGAPNFPRHHVINNLSKMADPMVYPLLFPCGAEGRSLDVRTITDNKTVSCRQFYRYRLQIRDPFSLLHHGHKLLQQYVVDAYCKAESDVLWFIRKNQHKFRLAAEQAVTRLQRRREAIIAAGGVVDPEDRIGRPVILPVSFQGGERNLERRYNEAMAVIARHGKPDLLITFTCNPRWPEIVDNLGRYQRFEHRPDLICRVFNLKLKEFMNDITQKQVYGRVLNYHYVIEFQKRGLPHAHIIITFVNDDKIRDADDVDGIVSAFIPDDIHQPLLYERVCRHEVHDQCAIRGGEATCMSEGKCRFNFPMPFADRTIINRGGNERPIYRRPRDGRFVVGNGDRQTALDNSRIVAYNAWALAKYNCHLNFEVVGSIKSVKYLHKYLHKGLDSIRVNIDAGDEAAAAPVNELDEVQRYLNCRYITSVEATWKLFDFKMHDRSHSVCMLPVHLAGFREILFDENDDVELIQAALNKPSKLEAFFQLNLQHPPARDLFYIEIPEHFTWQTRTSTWAPRRVVSKMIGMIFDVTPNDPQIEKFYLRILLLHVKGPTSYEDLRTFNGELLPDFKTACERRNLLKDAAEYDRCMREAVIKRMPGALRRLFATICAVVTDDDLQQIPILWQRYRRDLIDDYLRRGMTYRAALENCVRVVDIILARSRAGATLRQFGVTIADEDVNLMMLTGEEGNNIDNDNNNDDDDDDNDDDDQFSKFKVQNLNQDQKLAFVTIVNSIKFLLNHGPLPLQFYDDLGDNFPTDVLTKVIKRNVFYLDGPGGTGKTFLYNTLLRYVNLVFKRPTIAVAWTGIAANLLVGGQTVHRAFKLPLALGVATVAGWPLEHDRSEQIRRTGLIIWDEAPMTPKYAVEAVDRYLREVMGRNDLPFGGKCVVFGGDFRQILPVVKTAGSGRAEIVAACLKQSHLWPDITHLKLKVNMRATTSPDRVAEETAVFGSTFSDWLIKLGNGTVPYVNFPDVPHAPNNLIQIPERLVAPSLQQLINFVYNDIDAATTAQENTAILCPTNASVNEVNRIVLDKIGGPAVTYFSVDEYKEQATDNFHVPLEMVHAVDVPSLPPHELTLKRGAVVMLLRNLDIARGQCNGTRLVVLDLKEHYVECRILTGTSKGKITWIPRIKMTVKDTILPQPIERFQFPLRLAFCMTINKSQGQTLSKMGIYLKTPCFTHGQLYVAFSRVGNWKNIKCFIEPSHRQGPITHKNRRRYTSNVIYYEILNRQDREAVNRITQNAEENERSDDEEDVWNDERIDGLLMQIGEDNEESLARQRNDDEEYNYAEEQSVGDGHIPRKRRRPSPGPIRITTPTSDVGYPSSPSLSPPAPSEFNPFIPLFTDSQLQRRVAVGDRAGTSRMPGEVATRPPSPPRQRVVSNPSDSDSD